MKNSKLVELVRKNDKKALEIIYSNMDFLIKSITKFGIYDMTTKESIAYDTITLFWEKCKDLKFTLNENVKLRTYLYSIARYKCYKIFSDKNNNFETYVSDMGNYHDDSHITVYGESFQSYSFKKAVSMLSPSNRKFINLLLDGKSYKDIQKEMGYSNTDVIKSKKLKIKNSIKKKLKDLNYQEI